MVLVSAAPERGKANAAVAALLAEILAVKPAQVALASAAANPRKVFRISGLDQAEVDRRLGRFL
jgi:hypothetical protein